jgi:hypothetical protein
VRPSTADEDLDHQQRLALNRGQFDVRQQAWRNVVGNQAAQALFLVERIVNANDGMVVRDSDHQTAPSGVCEGDEGFQQRLGRKQVVLEFEGFAFGKPQPFNHRWFIAQKYTTDRDNLSVASVSSAATWRITDLFHVFRRAPYTDGKLLSNHAFPDHSGRVQKNRETV